MVVGLAVETYTLIAANREGRVDIYNLTNRQVQAVIGILTGRALLDIGVVIRLVSTDTMPEERNLIRTDNSGCIHRIYVIYSEFQDIDTVATEAVGAIVIVYAGLRITRAVPVIILTVIHVVDEAVGVRF